MKYKRGGGFMKDLRRVVRSGKYSMALTIPSSIVKALDIKPSDVFKVTYDEKNQTIVFKKVVQ